MKKPNKVGCKPQGDICAIHDEPLVCRHGCSVAEEHKCQDK